MLGRRVIKVTVFVKKDPEFSSEPLKFKYMRVEQLYTECLAEAAYYIESEGEAVIIDPLREVNPYLEKASGDGAKIKYIFETHFHADFVSGHLDLAKRTGAKIVYGPTALPDFEAHIAADEEVFQVGKVKLKLLHTPGHTMESSCLLLIDENGEEKAIFTGDTLFIGDVGRPDLAVKSDLSKEDLAGYLYDSIHSKLMPLADELIIYPGHGAGSACGKNLAKETYDTLGNQKQVNYALQAKNKEDFVKVVTDGILPPPQYFPKNAVMNKMGYESIDTILARGVEELDWDTFQQYKSEGALLLDTRHQTEYMKGAIPGSLFVGIDGAFANWVGTLIENLNQKIVLIAEPSRVEEIVTRLARVGYDNCLGYLKGGVETWKNNGGEVRTIESINAVELSMQLTKEDTLWDVRKPTEFQAEHAIDAKNNPLAALDKSEIATTGKNFVYCAGGYRSVIAISMLQNQGVENVVNINGGFQALKGAEYAMSEFVCPSTL